MKAHILITHGTWHSLLQALAKGLHTLMVDDLHGVWLYTVAAGRYAVVLNNSPAAACIQLPWEHVAVRLTTDASVGVWIALSARADCGLLNVTFELLLTRRCCRWLSH